MTPNKINLVLLLAISLGFMVITITTAILSTPSRITLPGCPSKCGHVEIPYPFGIRNGCFFNEHFSVYCNDTFNPPKPFISGKNIEVLKIHLNGRLRALTFVAVACYNPNKELEEQSFVSYTISPVFPFSFTRNKFVAIGCDTFAVVNGIANQMFETGCLSVCKTYDSLKNGTCEGIGCCQTSIPRNLFKYDVTMQSSQNHSTVWNFSRCSYCFLVENASFSFTTANLTNINNKTRVPSVLDWAVGDQRCEQAKKVKASYACKENSECYNPDNGPGYRCGCLQGYSGNPYLPNGCQVVDECKDPKRNTGKGCPNRKRRVTKGVAGGVGGLAGLLVGALSYMFYKNKKLRKQRQTNFQENGGPLLQEKLADWEGQDGADDSAAATIYSSEAIDRATGNYDQNKVIRQGGQYRTVYKGRLPNNNSNNNKNNGKNNYKTVAINKYSKSVDRNQIGKTVIDQFINEVDFLSHINHKNLVKLLGCCLEKRVPSLVYDYVTDDTLHSHIHDARKASVFSWELRLKVAEEIAGVLAYMHSQGFIHRDLKSQNVLLDENFTPKVSDFGASSLVPMDDEDQIPKVVEGSLGYLDPEYMVTSELTDKSDVYSFGVVLVELMTGKDVKNLNKTRRTKNNDRNKSLAFVFLSALKRDRLLEVIAESIEVEGNEEQINAVGDLAKRCLSVKAEERPTMEDVAMELEEIRNKGRDDKLANDESNNAMIDIPPSNDDDNEDGVEF